MMDIVENFIKGILIKKDLGLELYKKNELRRI